MARLVFPVLVYTALISLISVPGVRVTELLFFLVGFYCLLRALRAFREKRRSSH